MVEFVGREMCDKCKKLKPIKEISRMEGVIKMSEGICVFWGRAICKECDNSETWG